MIRWTKDGKVSRWFDAGRSYGSVTVEQANELADALDVAVAFIRGCYIDEDSGLRRFNTPAEKLLRQIGANHD